MRHYAAFLRGINVGGHRIAGPDLRGHVAALGFADVQAFRASGNVIFEAGASLPAAITIRIEEGLAGALGYAVPTFLRAAKEVLAIAAFEPFAPKRVEASAGKLQVAMLSRKPSPRAKQKALALASDEDLLALEGRELYWLPSGGTQQSELDLKALTALLGVSTMRTKGTVEQIAGKYFAG